MDPEIGNEIGRMIKELKDSGGLDTATALKEVVDQFQAVMQTGVKNYLDQSERQISSFVDSNPEVGKLLTDMTDTMAKMARLQQTSNDIQQKILSNAM